MQTQLATNEAQRRLTWLANFRLDALPPESQPKIESLIAQLSQTIMEEATK